MDLDVVVLDLGAWQCRAAVRRAGTQQFSEPVIVPTMLGKAKGSKKSFVADEVQETLEKHGPDVKIRRCL